MIMNRLDKQSGLNLSLVRPDEHFEASKSFTNFGPFRDPQISKQFTGPIFALKKMRAYVGFNVKSEHQRVLLRPPLNSSQNSKKIHGAIFALKKGELQRAL